MKFVKSVFILLALFLIVNSCQPQKDEFKVGFLFHNFDVPRWEKEKNFFTEKISEFGGSVIAKSAGGSELKQRNQALELINEGVDALIVIPVNASAAEIVRLAHDKGIKVISYAGMIPNCDLDYHVEFDGLKAGELQAKYLIDRKPNGKFVLINAGDASTPFYRGNQRYFKPYIDNGQIKIVYSAFIEGWSPKGAAYYTEEILEFSNSDIDGILSVNDGMATGIVEVLRKRGLNKKILLTGMDADLAACWRILNNEQSMTIYKPSKLIAYACADLVYKIINHEKVDGLIMVNNGRKNVPTLAIEPEVVDKSNLEATIVAEGVFTMDEIVNYSKLSK